MSKHFVGVALVLALLGAGGWALAQQGGSAAGAGGPVAEPGPGAQPNLPVVLPAGGSQPAAPAAQATPGRYTVAAAGAQAVLLDTATGKTWLLQAGRAGRAVWMPAQRLDSDKDLRKWLQEEKASDADQDKIRAEERWAARRSGG
jgi:hypothetical protein